MNDTQLQKILKRLDDHEKRIRTLEEKKGESADFQVTKLRNSPKIPTLAEIVRGKSFKSGQEKVAVIVGYFEKIAQIDSIKEADIRDGWKAGKFDGKYNPNLLARTIRDGLVRNINSVFDLSQTGENFFADFLKSDA